MNTPKRVHVIGLTGGIASGKSTVRQILSEFPHVRGLDADKLGHLAYAPGTETIDQLVKAFGEGIISPEGTINRATLGSIVFNDKSKLQTLNDIVWPAIKRLALREIQQEQPDQVKIFVFEAAVLVEAKWTDIVDEVWVVKTNKARERLLLRNPSFTPKDADARILAQAEVMERRLSSAHLVLENDGTTEQLLVNIHEQLKELEDRLCSNSSNGSELVDVVDPHSNTVIDVRKRAVIRAFNLSHRATYVAVLHQPTGKYFVQQRSASKEYAPLFFDPCPGGVVSAGETYEENAEKEMQEEMGIVGVPFQFIDDFWFESQRVRTWGRIFLCKVSKPFPQGYPLQESEVHSVHLMSREEILVSQRNRMTPDGLMAFERFVLKTSVKI